MWPSARGGPGISCEKLKPALLLPELQSKREGHSSGGSIMAARQLHTILRHLHHTIRTQTVEGCTDGQLLERFTRQQDAAAFEALVHRHGPMVLGVCRRVLVNEHEAEDAFQATLLVLVRKAAAIRKHESVGSWLYGVAYRIALKARALALRRAWHESRAQCRLPADSLAEMVWQDLRPVLDEELNRLPEQYRAPVVLCYLQGKTNEEAAQQLHWPPGTVKARLARARALLQTRLTRRGCTLSAGALAMLLEQGVAPAAVPAMLVSAIVKTATLWAAGEAVLAGGVSGKAVTLLDGMVRTMFLAKVKLGAAALLAVTVAAIGAGLAVHQAVAARQGEGTVPGQAPAPAKQTASAKAEGKPARQTDLYGDPLPAGAVARLGSLQLRHYGLSNVAFGANGTTLVSVGADRLVRFWNVAAGTLVRTIQLQGTAGPGYGASLSADGKTLACWDNGAVYFWDTNSGKELKRFPCPLAADPLSYLSLSPDGQSLAVGSEAIKVIVADWNSGKQRQLRLPTRWNWASPDSTYHACYSPDGKRVVTGAGGQQPLCIWDVATGQELRRIDDWASVSAFSPDGQRLAVASMAKNRQSQDTVLRLYEVATGKEVWHVPLPGKGFYWWIAFAPDGKLIAPVDTEGIYLLDRRTGQEVRRLKGRFAGRESKAFFSPDGRFLAGVGANRIRLWDVVTGTELHDRPGNGEATTAGAYSPDGRWLVTGAWVDGTLGVWDTVTGRRLRLLDWNRNEGYVHYLHFSTDRRTLVSGHYEGLLHFFDIGTGKIEHTLSLNEARKPKKEQPKFWAFHRSPDGRRVITLEEPAEVAVWETDPGRLIASQTFRPAPRSGWAPLGEQVALLTADGIVVVNSGSGQFHLRVSGACNAPLVASPNHKLLAAPAGGQQQSAVRVWEVLTGKEVATLRTGPVTCLGLVRDGRTLVTVDAASLRLWDLASGQERHRFAFPKDFAVSPDHSFVQELYLSPDGRRATTALGDGTLLVWELPGRSRPVNPEREPLDTTEAARLWADLASEDAAKAYGAIWKLADAPGPAVALLRQNLKPVGEEDFKNLRPLLRDLEDDRFAVREAAAKELQKRGAAVTPVLREVLAGNPSLELRRHLETRLAKAVHAVPVGEGSRRLRAIQVLEQIGSPEARRVLEVLAGGEPAAWETQEAKASLQRLAR
jgi:RNA polymerase sigma factor (sigma-70 family)